MDISCCCMHTLIHKGIAWGRIAFTDCQSWNQAFLLHLDKDRGFWSLPKCFTVGWANRLVYCRKFWRMSACHWPHTCFSARSLFAVSLPGDRIAFGQNKSDNSLLAWRILLSTATLGHTECHLLRKQTIVCLESRGDGVPYVSDILFPKIIG